MPQNAAFPEILRKKIEQFELHAAEYRNPSYKEARTRIEFIDSLLEALGWDVANRAGEAERWKNVVVEPAQNVEGHKRSPDYALRTQGENAIFVEAKKPSVRLSTDADASLQARRYAWSGKLPIVVLTNFQELAIYDGTVMPKPGDGARVARLHYFVLDELEENWGVIESTLSRQAVEAGSLRKLQASLPSRSGKDRIDNVFLRDLESARATLATHVAELNPYLTDDELIAVVQLTLDRIIFLRICEDRGVETFGELRSATYAPDVRAALNYLFASADARYNSGLFHFDPEPGRPEPDVLSQNIKIDDTVLADTIQRFYPPRSPYAFSVMPVEILGRAYENFLAKRIVRKRGVVSLELKPEYRKAGGVFYTPEWLCKAVVERTVGPMLKGKSPDSLWKNTGKYRVLDPACGSGSFLVAAYKYFLDWYLNHYLESPSRWMRSRPARLERNQSGELALSLSERKRILLEHIFGVDLDPQAVEIAKLSLLIIVLEDQTGTGLQEQLAVFKERLLPDLGRNIRCGNSLISPDALTDKEIIQSMESRHLDIRPLDWRREFGGKFRAIVGNPPWLMAGYEIEPQALTYLKKKYASYTGKADLYYLFLERSLQLITEGGRISMVVPNKMFTTKAGRGIRKLLGEKSWVEEIIDFQTEKIFDKATNYTQVLVLTPSTGVRKTVSYRRALNYLTLEQEWALGPGQLTEERWDTNSPEAREVWHRISSDATPLAHVVAAFGNGVQTGADPVMVLSGEDAREIRIENAYLKPLMRGQDIRGGFLAAPSKYVVFPYVEVDGGYQVLNKYQLARAPYLSAYLYDNEVALRKRLWFGKSALDLTGEWWGLMHLDSAAAFSSPHLLTPSLSNHSNFALGDGSLFPTGTAGVTSLILKDGDDASWLLAILNSDLISSYIIAHSTPYQGGFFKFSAPYLKSVPIAILDDASKHRLGALWRSRVASATAQERVLVDQRISDVVNDVYGVNADDVDLISRQLMPLRKVQGMAL